MTSTSRKDRKLPLKMQNEPEQGQRILITGGTKGIGLACAITLAKQGHTLCVVGSSNEGIEFAKASLDAPRHTILKIDLSNQTGVDQLDRHLESQFDPDIIIHAIGGIPNLPPEVSESEQWTKVFWLNLFCIVALNKKIIKRMKSNGQGKIVHISSSAAEHGKASQHYACAKAALNQYIKSEGRALAKDGISISGIMPAATIGHGGYWDRQKATNQEKTQIVSNSQVLGKFSSTTEIAETVSFLCTPQGNMFSGCVLPADAAI